MPGRTLAAAALLLALVLAGAAAAVERAVPADQHQIRLSFAPVVREVAPAVVNITTRRHAPARRDLFFDDPFFRFFLDRPQQAPRGFGSALGSGVIVRPDGLIVTNHHVVEGADEIVVVLADRRELRASVVAADERSDLALLRVDTGGERLPSVRFGDSDRLEVGDLVLALGNPFGIGQTVTGGIVSATARTAPELESDVAFIQTDAAINPGNSGGALVTLDGSLAGINTAIFTRGGGSIGIGFAIPANLVRAMIDAVESGERRFTRPWIGIAGQLVDAELARELGLERPVGVLVGRVYPNGPADRAGLEPGDVLRSVDGVELDAAQALGFRLALRRPGERAEVEIWRRGQLASLQVPVEPPPYEPPPGVTRLQPPHPLAGLTVASLSPGFAGEIGHDPFERGVVVLDVVRGSRGHRLGLRPRDVVVAVEDRQITRTGELDSLLAARGPARLTLRRGGRTATLLVR
jgi:Do/DeqQ family serine protease